MSLGHIYLLINKVNGHKYVGQTKRTVNDCWKLGFSWPAVYLTTLLFLLDFLVVSSNFQSVAAGIASMEEHQHCFGF